MRRTVTLVMALLFALIAAGCASRNPSGTGSQAQDTGPISSVVIAREFEFEPRPLKVKAGTVRLRLINRGSVEHDFVIPSLGEHDEHDKHLVKPDQIKTLEFNLKPGTYEGVCTVPGHKEAGMKVVVEVSP